MTNRYRERASRYFIFGLRSSFPFFKKPSIAVDAVASIRTVIHLSAFIGSRNGFLHLSSFSNSSLRLIAYVIHQSSALLAQTSSNFSMPNIVDGSPELLFLYFEDRIMVWSELCYDASLALALWWEVALHFCRPVIGVVNMAIEKDQAKFYYWVIKRDAKGQRVFN